MIYCCNGATTMRKPPEKAGTGIGILHESARDPL